jgi:YggT family protein
MFDAITNAFRFLISTLADLYAFILIARGILVWARADYYNPVTRLIAKLTDTVVVPLKRFFPTVKKIELATLFLLFILELSKFLLLGLITLGMPHFLGLLLLSFAEIIKLSANIFFYAILIQAILSWVPYAYRDLYNLLSLITSPIMRPLHRLIPPVGGFDISPIAALIGLQFMSIILIDPLYAQGMNLAFG